MTDETPDPNFGVDPCTCRDAYALGQHYTDRPCEPVPARHYIGLVDRMHGTVRITPSDTGGGFRTPEWQPLGPDDGPPQWFQVDQAVYDEWVLDGAAADATVDLVEAARRVAKLVKPRVGPPLPVTSDMSVYLEQLRTAVEALDKVLDQ